MAVATAMLALTACSTPSGTPGDAQPPATGDPADASAVAPLTGVEVDDPTVLDRPVLAVKIDNAAAARPQVGLGAADVVLEELVEGGQTRFMALYQAETPEQVGPVRSGREVDAELLPAFDALLAMSGAADPVQRLLRDAQLRVFAEGRADGAFRREPTRTAPHDLMVSPAALWAAADGEPAAEPWPIDDSPPPGGEPAEGATLRFSPRTSVTWTRDGDGWVRDHNGERHRDAGGEPLRADTVVVARVDVTPGDRVDAGGFPTVAIDVTGEGEALILRDGQSFDGRWAKASAGDQFAWRDAAGQPLPVAPGRTWIELVPTDGEVTVQEGDGAVGGAGE